jgi:protein-L-isoaspartate(D-aspartate) O-methyltransferase
MVSPDFPAMRRAMIDSQLRTSGVSEPWIVAAMAALPRELFVPADRRATAYMDRSIPLAPGRALNPPLATGLMLGAAEVRGNDTVLLIGAGTGYLASLIAGRVTTVTAVEQSAPILEHARRNLAVFDNVALVEGPLNAGAEVNAPYSLIIIDGVIAGLPGAIAGQLAEGGRVVTGLIDGAVSRLAIGYKRGGNIVLRPIADCEIALLPGFEPAEEFVF